MARKSRPARGQNCIFGLHPGCQRSSKKQKTRFACCALHVSRNASTHIAATPMPIAQSLTCSPARRSKQGKHRVCGEIYVCVFQPVSWTSAKMRHPDRPNLGRSSLATARFYPGPGQTLLAPPARTIIHILPGRRLPNQLASRQLLNNRKRRTLRGCDLTVLGLAAKVDAVTQLLDGSRWR